MNGADRIPRTVRGSARARVALALLLPLSACADDPFGAGVRAFAEGRYAEAVEELARAEARAGHAAPPALLLDRALAALRTGRVREAEISAEKLTARGGAGFEGFRAFVFGNASWLRMERAKAEAGLTDPDPTAFARAIGHAEAARDAWVTALDTRGDWPEARRNVERAQRELEDLRRRKDEADANRKAKKEGAQERSGPEPEPDPSRPPEQVEQAPELKGDDGALTADQLEALLARLARKEQEKRALRQKQQAARTAGVERDW